MNKLALFDVSQLLFKICVLLFDKARFDIFAIFFENWSKILKNSLFVYCFL